MFGYKNHISIDRRYGFIRKAKTTSAADSDGRQLRDVVDTNNTASNALHGVDTVAFIKTGNRIQGAAKFAAVHDGVAYYFSTQENLDTFNANPAGFLPQNGGFCTFGVSVGKKFDGDPRWADVREGKLFVFLSEAIFNAYQKDPVGTIAKAKTNWKQIKHTAATEL